MASAAENLQPTQLSPKTLSRSTSPAVIQPEAPENDLDNNITVGQWLLSWRKNFTANIKESTAVYYDQLIRTHINPTLGEIPLASLKAPAIQQLYNEKLEKGELSAKSIKNLHGCLHKALDTAVKVEYLEKNPANACIIPRVVQKEITPIDVPDLKKLLDALSGEEYEALIVVALFTGMRSGELLGLTWDCIDFDRGTIHVTKQLVTPRKKGVAFHYSTTKNGKGRTLAPAPFVMDVLKNHRKAQVEQRLRIGPAWQDGGFPNLVFTHPDGSHLSQPTAWKILQKMLKKAGIDHHRFHDLRHTYVVNAIRAGDDIKTVQQNAGHYSASFTLDRYAHVTETMKKESAERMQNFFAAL